MGKEKHIGRLKLRYKDMPTNDPKTVVINPKTADREMNGLNRDEWTSIAHGMV